MTVVFKKKGSDGADSSDAAGTTTTSVQDPPADDASGQTETTATETTSSDSSDSSGSSESSGSSDSGGTTSTPAKASKPAKAPREKKTKAKKEKKEKPAASRGSWSIARVRTLIGRVVWLVFMVCAIVLALSAFMFALDFNDNNALVDFVYGFADKIDLGVFDVDNPIRTFRTDGARDLTKITLLNYGIGAIVYLVVGRILDRIIRP